MLSNHLSYAGRMDSGSLLYSFVIGVPQFQCLFVHLSSKVEVVLISLLLQAEVCIFFGLQLLNVLSLLTHRGASGALLGLVVVLIQVLS
jgi:hypothetical protein